MLAVRGLLAFALAICGFMVAGCASKKPLPPLVAPQTRMELSHFTGTALSGPLAPAVEVTSPEEAMAVHLSVFALEAMPAGGLPPLGPKARFIAASSSGRALEPSTHLTIGTELSMGADAEGYSELVRSEQPGKSVEMGSFAGALPRGATVVLTTVDLAPSKAGDREFAVYLSRRGASSDAATIPVESIELAVILQDWVAVKEEAGKVEENAGDPITQPRKRDEFNQEIPPLPPTQVLQREIAVVDDLPVGEQLPLALVIPFPMDNGRTKAIAIFIDVSPGAAGELHDQAVAQCREDLLKSAESVAARPVVFVGNSDWPGFENALEAIRQPGTRRAAMVFLASQTGASICEDVALVSDELLLDQLSQNVSQNVTATKDARTRETLGWLLDYTALDLLTKLQVDGKLPPELESVLSLHAGEAGRHASSMEEIMRNLPSRKDLQSRLVAENLIYLEDSSPAARMRAYDWLTAQEQAPADFDPLADNKQRRESLQRALDALQAQSAEGAAP